MNLNPESYEFTKAQQLTFARGTISTEEAILYERELERCRLRDQEETVYCLVTGACTSSYHVYFPFHTQNMLQEIGWERHPFAHYDSEQF